jgi:predicted dehydrogenase
MAALQGLPQTWSVAGIVEPDPARRTGVFAGIPSLTEIELLGRSDVRAVAIETAVEESCATATRCLRAGKHIHLDKTGAIDHA